MTVGSSGWWTWAKNDFLSSSVQLCKVYLKVHQKVKSIFILWDSLSFWSGQLRKQIGFRLVWVKGVLQPSYFQSEDWALILGCYKTGNAQARFSNIKVFNLKVVFLSYSIIALSPQLWAVLASFLQNIEMFRAVYQSCCWRVSNKHFIFATHRVSLQHVNVDTEKTYHMVQFKSLWNPFELGCCWDV